MADGRYEVKVVASDAAANPPGQGKTASRVSDPVVVDNTPPVIGDLKATEQGGGGAKIATAGDGPDEHGGGCDIQRRLQRRLASRASF